MDREEKEYIRQKHLNKETKEPQKPVKEKMSKTKKTVLICMGVVFITVVVTLLNPDLIARLNLFKNNPEPEVIEPEPKVDKNNEEENLYYVDFDTYYAYGIKGVIEGDFDGVWYALSAPNYKYGVVDELDNLKTYFSASNKKYKVLNPSVTEPEFYLIFKIAEKSEIECDYDGLVTGVFLRNKNTNKTMAYYFEPVIKLILNEGK